MPKLLFRRSKWLTTTTNSVASISSVVSKHDSLNFNIHKLVLRDEYDVIYVEMDNKDKYLKFINDLERKTNEALEFIKTFNLNNKSVSKNFHLGFDKQKFTIKVKFSHIQGITVEYEHRTPIGLSTIIKFDPIEDLKGPNPLLSNQKKHLVSMLGRILSVTTDTKYYFQIDLFK